MVREKREIYSRIYSFVLEVLNFVKNVPRTTENLVLIRQLVRSASSIGANAEEADASETKKEFIYRFTVSKKEAKETLYWIRLLSDHNPKLEKQAVVLLEENEQLIAIISKIVINTKKRK